ncbi:killer protein [Pseudomonas syringae pv. solidagae]|uniref:Uncharacterized protein n=1 Tax=Pseudomonas syringae pv. solidagae TaxID=264458 RepID=A0A0N8SRP5_PSESX|nr:killer protein [Pseudomonas syringae pv. solidagae]RMT38751.1 hypothetical protein ALP48_200089 [Pseudomonas syringae pv. solidagae]
MGYTGSLQSARVATFYSFETKKAYCQQGLAQVHRVAIKGSAATRLRFQQQGGRLGPGDDVNHHRSRRQLLCVYRHRVIRVHAERGSIDHDVIACSICLACMHSARTLSGDTLRQVQRAVRIQVRNDQRPSASSGDGKRYCPSRTARTNKQNGFPQQANALTLHAQDAAKPVEYGTHPAPVAITTNDIDCADLTRSRVKNVHHVKHALLVRHGDQKPGKVAHGTYASHKVSQAFGTDFQWNTDGVRLRFGK